MTSKNCDLQRGTHNQQAGFTLLEMLIAITLFILVTGTIYGMLAVARADRFTVSRRVDAMQSARNAINSIGRDVLNAGYGYPNVGGNLPQDRLFQILNLPFATGPTPDPLTPIISGNNLNPNSLSGVNTDQITFVFQDVNFNNGQTLPVKSIAAGGNSVTIDTSGPDGITGTADDLVNPSTLGTPNALYVISGGTGSVVATMTATPPGNTWNFANGDPLNINQTGSSNIIKSVSAPATITKITMVTYRVLNDGTLVRTVYGGAAPGQVDQPLAYNIENMQIQYVLKDGSIVDDPVAGPDGVTGNADDTPAKLQDVRQVRVTVTVQSPERDQRNNQPVRIPLTCTFNTRNLGYDAR
jgi:type II secretory pathway pseudopilin PulG